MPMLDLDDPKTLTKYPQAIEIFPPNFFENINIANSFAESLAEPIRQFNENFLLSFQKAFEDINKNLGQMLAAQMKVIDLAETFRFYYPPTQIVDAEPVPLLPTISNKTRMGILITKIGTFKYRRKALKGLSKKNIEGRVLALFMNSNLFASDEDIQKITYTKSTRDFSWVMNHLKRKFKDNDLIIDIERIWNPDGYTIRSITFLQ